MQHFIALEIKFSIAKKKETNSVLMSVLTTAVARQFLCGFIVLHILQGKQVIQPLSVQSFLCLCMGRAHRICLTEQVSTPHVPLFQEISHHSKIILDHFNILKLC